MREERKKRARQKGKKGRTYAAAAVPDDEHEATPAPAVLVTFLIQRRQAGAVLLDAVGQRPVVDQLQPRRDQESDLLGQRAREETRGWGRAFLDAAQGEGR